MKAFFVLLLGLPLVAIAQCPQWIQQPFVRTKAFMGLMEQRLSFKFTDSSISPARDKMVFNDQAGKYILKVTAQQDTVTHLRFEAPPAAMNEFESWFNREFLECATHKSGNTLVFPDCVVTISSISDSKRIFVIAKK